MGKEPYCKVPLSVFRAAMALPRTSQQDALIAAYVRYFLTGDAGNVPKCIRAAFEVVKGTADAINSSRTDGAAGWAVNPRNPRSNSARDSRNHGDKSEGGSTIVGRGEDKASTSGNDPNPYIPPFDPITNTNTRTSTSSRGVGVAVEPPTPEEVRKLFADVLNDPESAPAFIEYGEGNGWRIPGIETSLSVAAIQWGTTVRSRQA